MATIRVTKGQQITESNLIPTLTKMILATLERDRPENHSEWMFIMNASVYNVHEEVNGKCSDFNGFKVRRAHPERPDSDLVLLSVPKSTSND